MHIHKNAPTRLYFDSSELKQITLIKTFLTFTNKNITHQLQQFKKNKWFAYRDPDGYLQRLNELKEQQRQILLFQDEDKDYYTYVGLQKDLEKILNTNTINDIQFPTPSFYPWNKQPHALRPYQREIVDALIQAKHGAVEVATGLGKSLCINYLIKELGLRTVVMVPSKSIAKQLHTLFVNSFGPKLVGLFGDGKKDSDKKIVIGIAASLYRVQPGSEDWQNLSKADMIVVDESHLVAADTLEAVAVGLLAKASYRVFFSATQRRVDGKDLLLRGITGDIVYSMSIVKGIDEGWLARPNFKMLKSWSRSTYNSDNILKMNQKHLLYNPKIAQLIANLINSFVIKGQNVLVLVDEIEQFPLLEPLVTTKMRFAHGGGKEAERVLSPEYLKIKPQELVDQFNKNMFSVLVGTSCISLGTDITSVENIIFWKGGKSSIELTQSIGRGTRKGILKDNTIKQSFNFIDFCVQVYGIDDNDKLSCIKRHALDRASIMKDLYDNLQWVEVD
jgi:superfamily II DNA or RNA helicase